jgi:hypothetical protein
MEILMARGKYAKGTRPPGFACGESNPMSKLRQDQVDCIRRSEESCKALCKRFGVAQSTVSMVRTGRTCSDVEATTPVFADRNAIPAKKTTSGCAPPEAVRLREQTPDTEIWKQLISNSLRAS